MTVEQEQLTRETDRIRQLLNDAVTDEKLTEFCFDHFRPVYDNFGDKMSKGQKIQLLLDYCDRHGQLEKLLELVQVHNPYQYARFARQPLSSSQPIQEPHLEIDEETEAIKKELALAQAVLKKLSKKVQELSSTKETIPLDLKLKMDEQQRYVQELKTKLASAKQQK